MGRPTKRQQINKKIGEGNSKLKPDRLKKLEEAFALDCSIAEACYYADITEATYYNWKKKKPKIFERLEALRNRPVLIARKTVVDALKTDSDIALKYLERKRKKEFSLRQELDNSGEQKIIIEKVIKSSTDETED